MPGKARKRAGALVTLELPSEMHNQAGSSAMVQYPKAICHMHACLYLYAHMCIQERVHVAVED